MQTLQKAAVLASCSFVVIACSARVAADTSTSQRATGATAAYSFAPDSLQRRVREFSHDSMLGRRAGTAGHDRATEYLAREAARLGLVPAGEDGSWFQDVPVELRQVSATSDMSVKGHRLTIWRDYIPMLAIGRTRPFDGARVIYGGVTGDSGIAISATQARGRVVLLGSPAGASSVRVGTYASDHPLAHAAAVIITGVDGSFQNLSRRASEVVVLAPSQPTTSSDNAERLAHVTVPTAIAELLLGIPLSHASPGKLGEIVNGQLAMQVSMVTTRNVLALLPGQDSRLRSQYVALGAHSDHIGFTRVPVDHDSMHVFRAGLRRAQLGEAGALTSARVAAINAAVDSVRRSRTPRLDSIYNGADDNASGSMVLLALADAMSRQSQNPLRSILFVWHTAEEIGMHGARWFTDHPTVPLDSVVAHLNVDMLGRGREGDEADGGPRYLQLIGAQRQSSALGDLIAEVNLLQSQPFTLDTRMDAPGHPQNMFCRSDHAMYARYGIPVAFFTSGLHGDYHQLTDEADYLDYGKLAAASQLLFDVTMRLANADRRPALTAPRPDPAAPCRQ